MDELEFERGQASLATLTGQTKAILKALGEGEGRAELVAAGFDPSTLAGVDFDFTTRQAGALGVGEVVIVSVAASHVLAPVAKKVLLDLWKVIVLPRIRRRFGEDALGPLREPVARKSDATKSEPKQDKPKTGEKRAAKGKSAGGKPNPRS